jgi:hypothetical protein
MKKVVLLTAGLFLVCAASAEAAGTVQTAQQTRMKTCAAEYHQKKIAKSQYHAFMSQCLKTHPGKASVGAGK